MTDTKALAAAEAARWAAMHIDPKRKPEFEATAKRLVAPAAKTRYLKVQARTGVPWWFVAVVHEREAGQRWDRHLGQGDPLDKKTVHVPAGRGPFFGPEAFEDGAYDALVNCAPYAARNKDWSIGPALEKLEEYNGLGYAGKGVPSPYDWSGTDQYKSGKYVADHVYDASAVDRQLGCAALLACMAEIDPDVHFDGTAPVPATPIDTPPPIPRTDVRQVQRVVGVAVDGVFGPDTKAAVIAFQGAHGLTPDGIVGPKTAQAIALADAAPKAPEAPSTTPVPEKKPIAAPVGNGLVWVLQTLFNGVRALLAKKE